MKSTLVLIVAAVLLVGCGSKKRSHEDKALETAAFTGNIEAAKIAIANGANVNARHELTQITPLHTAAAYNKTNIIELLLAEGADVNTQGLRDGTPLDNARKNAADLLRKHGGKTGEELKAEGK